MSFYNQPPQGGFHGQQQIPVPSPFYPEPGYGRAVGFDVPRSFTPPPPSGITRDAWKLFLSVDRDGSRMITANELQIALKNGNGREFQSNTVKMLVNMFDNDRNGTIGPSEFQGIYDYIKQWESIFIHFDLNRSGDIEERELLAALEQFGLPLSQTALERLLTRHVPSLVQQGPYGYRSTKFTFDQFIMICVVAKSLHDYYIRESRSRLAQGRYLEVFLDAPY